MGSFEQAALDLDKVLIVPLAYLIDMDVAAATND